jgi:lipid-binding SYLF domain-containing protein
MSFRISRSIARAVLPAIGALLPMAVMAQEPDGKHAERAQKAGEVIAELVREPDHSPPQSLLRNATCVAVVPDMLQAGLGVGGKVGFGLASCRTATGWSQPTYMALKGGTFGFQVGAQSADIVLVFMNKDAPRQIGSSSFDIGGQASVAAGPVGRNLSAETDYKLNAEIYSYSRTKGLFAGITLSGTKWEIDSKANRAVYGKSTDVDVQELLTTNGANAPAVVQPFLASLRQYVGPQGGAE